jgi:hypothetical protein
MGCLMQVERRSFAAARDALRGRRCVLLGGNSGDAETENGAGGGEGGERGGDGGLIFVAAESVALHCRGDLAPALFRLPDELEPWQSLFVSLGK